MGHAPNSMPRAARPQKPAPSLKSMQVDYVKLTDRIRELVCAKLTPRPMPTISSLASTLVERIVWTETTRLNLLGDGVKIHAECETCMDLKTLKRAAVVHHNWKSVVYDTGAREVMKVMEITSRTSVTTSVQHALKVSKLSVGPMVKSWRVCECGGKLFLIIVMVKLKGQPLEKWIKTKRGKAMADKVKAALEDKLKKLSKAGIKLGYFWKGDVLVDASDEPWIVGLSHYKREDERPSFDVDSFFANYKKRPANEAGAVYAALVKEGLVSETFFPGTMSLPPRLRNDYGDLWLW